MSIREFAKAIITMLRGRDFYAQCPCCDEPIALDQAGLFFLDDFTEKGQELYNVYLEDIRERRAELRLRKENISTRSQSTAKAVNVGAILEQLAPSMGGFPFECGDCRSLFKPIDYVIFRGLASKGRVDRIVFGDIKTGQARLSTSQREIRDLVERGKVEWDIYTPEDL